MKYNAVTERRLICERCIDEVVSGLVGSYANFASSHHGGMISIMNSGYCGLYRDEVVPIGGPRCRFSAEHAVLADIIE
jgi:hypothetical protein